MSPFLGLMSFRCGVRSGAISCSDKMFLLSLAYMACVFTPCLVRPVAGGATRGQGKDFSGVLGRGRGGPLGTLGGGVGPPQPQNQS